MVTLEIDNFSDITARLERLMLGTKVVDNLRWQGIDVSKDPSAQMYELRNVVFEVPLNGVEDLDEYRRSIRPNFPWADDHFLERVGGEPLNPGVQWANWPWATSADKHRSRSGGFNHTYMQRLWPKWAGRTPDGKLDESDKAVTIPHQGIGWIYGDLNDLVDLLVRDPFTRQAWIPLFFPEDTGWGDGGRKMCSLGYHLMRRGNGLHLWYPLRSCDLVRHFRDDVYLAVRLMLWVLDKLRERDPLRWCHVGPESYAMHMTSLHCFVNDWIKLRSEHAEARK